MNPIDLREAIFSRPLILILDEGHAHLSPLKKDLVEEYEVLLTTEREEAIEMLKTMGPPVMILQLGRTLFLSEGQSMAFWESINNLSPQTKIIFVTEAIDQRKIVQTIRSKAFDLLFTPLQTEVVRLTLRRALYVFELEEKNRTLEKDPQHQTSHMLIGNSQPMQEVFSLIRKVGPTDVTVLITGETGTGKEMVARAMHAESTRKDGPFLNINCAAIPENLLESELFGYEKGAFTGAYETRKGRFELAHRGTLLLDEIGELSCVLQAKLLHFLQEHTLQRVGGMKNIPLDVRVIAATNRDISQLIAANRFREDLYYRICTIPIHLPPLREREEDIILLAETFLDHFSSQFRKKTRFRGFTAEAMVAMTTYSWPGNVREMENRIKKAILLSDGPYIGTQSLELQTVPKQKGRKSLKKAKEELERSMLMEAFTKTGGRLGLAAKELGISRQFVRELVKKHDLDALKKMKSIVRKRVG